MREVALKAATVESTTGLLKIMDDIARLRAAPPPPIAEGGYRLPDATGLVRVERLRPALGNGTEPAAPGTDVSKQHERRRAVVPAFANIGALR